MRAQFNFSKNFIFCGILIASFALSIREVLADNVLVAYALDADLAALKKKLGEGISVRGKGAPVTRLSFGEDTLFCIKMRSGCIDTAASVSSILGKESIALVVSTGPFGGIDDSIKRWQWIRVSKVIAHQMTPPKAYRLPKTADGIATGAVASGEAFITNTGDRDAIAANTGCVGVDMNLLGLAIACERFGIGLVAYRQCSDSANEAASEDFKQYVDKYEGEGANLILKFLEARKLQDTQYPNIQILIEDEKK